MDAVHAGRLLIEAVHARRTADRHLTALGIDARTLEPATPARRFTADGRLMRPPRGKLRARLQLGEASCVSTMEVYEGVDTPLLSCEDCRALRIIPRKFPTPLLQEMHVQQIRAADVQTAEAQGGIGDAAPEPVKLPFTDATTPSEANTVRACEACQPLQPSQQREPLRNDDQPTRPFESVSADFFQVAGRSFLVIVDRLSN